MTTAIDSCPLRDERLRQGFSQSELAFEAGVTRETVGRLEHGMPPQLRTARAIAQALDVPVAELFPSNGDGRPGASQRPQ